jgi:phospholipase/carboxylesterase
MHRRHLTLAFATSALSIISAAGVIGNASAGTSKPPIKKAEHPMDSAIVVQKPIGTIQQLVLFFHGVGSNAQDLVPVAQQFAQVHKHAMVVSINGAQPSDFGSGRQWFSVAGVTEANRAARVAMVMPSFQSTVQQWQKLAGVSSGNTILVGFSQGSIMALESTQLQPPLAGRVIAFSGRFALEPKVAPIGMVINLIHGSADAVIDADHSLAAARQLMALGAKVTVDIVPGMTHGIDARMVSLALSKIAGQQAAI